VRRLVAALVSIWWRWKATTSRRTPKNLTRRHFGFDLVAMESDDKSSHSKKPDSSPLWFRFGGDGKRRQVVALQKACSNPNQTDCGLIILRITYYADAHFAISDVEHRMMSSLRYCLGTEAIEITADHREKRRLVIAVCALCVLCG